MSEISKLTAAQATRLAQFWDDAQTTILDELRRGIEGGSVVANRDAILARIYGLLSELDAGSGEWIAEAFPELYQAGMAEAARQLAHAGIKATGNAPLHDQAVQLTVDAAGERLSATVQFIGTHVGTDLRAAAVEELKGTTNAADTWQMLVDSGRSIVTQRPDGSTYLGVQVSPDGKMWDMATYSEMVARTETANAYRDGVSLSLQDNGVDLVDLEGGADPCDSCAEAVNKGPYSLTGATDGVMTLDEAEATYDHLFGPNCTHYPVAAGSALS